MMSSRPAAGGDTRGHSVYGNHGTDPGVHGNGNHAADPEVRVYGNDQEVHFHLLTTGQTKGDNTGNKLQDNKNEEEDQNQKPLLYRVNETPPFHLLLLFAIQQSLLCIGSPLVITVIVSEVVCAKNDDVIKTQILSAAFFMTGLSTFAMSTFGVRIPVFQGPGITYLIPLLAMRQLPEWKCPAMFPRISDENTTMLMADMGNGTFVAAREVILEKISRLSGSLMLAGALHFIIGATGLVGLLLRFIGPVTLVPPITLLGLYIYEINVRFCETNWLVASAVCVLNLILSLFLSHKKTPIPLWSPQRGFYILWYPFHQVFSVLLSIIFGWTLSVILTEAGTMSDDPKHKHHFARTDSRLDIIHRADWFTYPYPGKFGGFSFSAAAFISFFISTIASVLDSIGDYSAVSKTARVSPPPKYAFNRGIAVEGIMSFICGSFGCCQATVSYGANIGAMAITRVVSRRVFQVCGLIYIMFAFFGKAAAVFITIPYPVIGGVSIIIRGVFIGVILSYLQAVNMNSSRNRSIIGIALLLGFMMPHWVNKNKDAIDTGYPEVDTAIRMLLGNPSFVGGVFACFMDNFVPGTLKERGMLEQLNELDGHATQKTPYEDGPDTYRLPFIPERFLKTKLAKYIPIFGYKEKKHNSVDEN
ncbi:unnamed protein product [Lymnaea stagnalis]|uniref:Solute carrier family 23 member 2 n=1 Tax=Lymnaea stagnalis TaxID=6523 RepID=A0AAV2HYI2_LYMST